MQKFDIYTATFAYQENLFAKDAEKQFKVRPVLILRDDIFVPIVMITGTANQDATTYEIIDWKEAGLTKPSYIKFSRKQLVNKRDLGSYVGHLSETDIQNLKAYGLAENLVSEDFTEKEFHVNALVSVPGFWTGERAAKNIKDAIEMIAPIGVEKIDAVESWREQAGMKSTK